MSDSDRRWREPMPDKEIIAALTAELAAAKKLHDALCDRAIALEDELAAARAENERLREGLEAIRSDAQLTIDLYNDIGPTWTTPAGSELYNASYVIESAQERIAKIAAALSHVPLEGNKE